MPRFTSALLSTLFSLVVICGSAGGQTPPITPKTVDPPLPTPVPLPVVPPPADVPNRPLTADEAARIALRLQPTIAATRAGITAAQGRSQQTRSALFPTLTLNGSYTDVEILHSLSSGSSTGGGTGSSGITPSSLGAGWLGTAAVRQLIFDFNHTRDLVRQSTALERVARQALSVAQENLVYNVKQAYYQYSNDLLLVTVQTDNLTNRQSQLALARARLNSGLGLPSDLATAETAVAQAAVSLSLAQNLASQSRVSLALQMGVDPRIPLQTSDAGEPPIPDNDVNVLIGTALRQRPEVLQAQANIDANHYALNAARTTNAPVISGNLQFLSRGPNFPTDNSGFSVAAAIQFSPFDGGLTAGRVKEARANLDIARANLLSAQQQAAADVSASYVNLRSAEQRVASANAEVANALENVRIAEGRYRAGLGLFLDIINAQAFVVTAQTDLVNARETVNAARAALQRAIGSSY